MTAAFINKFKGFFLKKPFSSLGPLFTSGRMHEEVRNMDDAMNLFDEMIQTRPLPCVAKFTQLLDAVTKMKRFSESLHIFKQMCAVGVPVDQYLMNIAIKCCCRLYRTNDGFAVLNWNFKRGITPDAYTFSALLNGLILEDRIVEAQRLFKHKVCEPNVVMYSTIIHSLCKNKLIDDAFRLFKEMVFIKGIPPNNITYTCLISGLCNLSRWDEVFEMLKKMEGVGISLDLQTVNVLVDAFCKDDKVEEAKAVVNLMVESGIVTYDSLIVGYCHHNQRIKARKIFDLMLSRNMVPSIITCNTLLVGHCKIFKIKEAMDVFDEIIRKGLKPNDATYHTLMWGMYWLQPDIDFTREGECSFIPGDSKISCRIDMYTILIHGAVRCGKFDTVKFLFHELTLDGLQPEKAYTVVINDFCRGGLLTEAKELFLKMDEISFLKNNVTYSVLLQGYLKNQHYDEVGVLLREMDGRGYSIDVPTIRLFFNRMIADSLDKGVLKFIGKLVPDDLF